MTDTEQVRVTVNGRAYSGSCEPRLTLSDFLRHECGLTGTHVGCEHGVCGACTVSVDGRTARSCLMLAVQADGSTITTVEGLSDGAELNDVQDAFWSNHGLQCGFCTPGMLMTASELLAEIPDPSERQVRERIAGNLCRCTGYASIVQAVLAAAEARRARSAAEAPADRDGTEVELARVRFIGGSQDSDAVTELEVVTGQVPPEELTVGDQSYVVTKQDDDGVWVYLVKPTVTP